jgi:hypothetical protein
MRTLVIAAVRADTVGKPRIAAILAFHDALDRDKFLVGPASIAPCTAVAPPWNRHDFSSKNVLRKASSYYSIHHSKFTSCPEWH